MPFNLLKYGLSSDYPIEVDLPPPCELKSSYDVVIIGGGGHGLATAYYLAKYHGITNVAVLEKAYLGGGNTARNTAVIRSNYLTSEGVRFYAESVKMFQSLSNEFDFNIMYSERGQLTLAHTDATVRSFRQRAEVNKHFGGRTEMIDRQQIRELVPTLNLDPGHGQVIRCRRIKDAIHKDHAQRIDVEPAVGFVQHGHARIEDAHLDHLGALLLAAGKADVHLPLEHVHVELQQPGLFARELEEIRARERLFPARLALRVQRLAQELDVRHAGNLHRVLEAEEQPRRSALVRLHVEQILPVEIDRTLGDLITGPPAEHIRQRRLARAIGTHDRMDFARIDAEREALEDRLVGDRGVEVIDLEHSIQS